MYDRAQYQAWLSYYRLIHERDPLGAFDAGYEGYELQPDNALVLLNLGYACLYCGWEEPGTDYAEAAKRFRKASLTGTT